MTLKNIWHRGVEKVGRSLSQYENKEALRRWQHHPALNMRRRGNAATQANDGNEYLAFKFQGRQISKTKQFFTFVIEQLLPNIEGQEIFHNKRVAS